MPRRTTRDDVRDMIVAVQLEHLGRTRKQIQDHLDVDASALVKLLARARRFYKLTYSFPRPTELEAELISLCGLKDARVVEGGLAEGETAVVGQAAAEYFATHVGQGQTVAVTCGQTILEMINAIPVQRDLDLRLVQLSLEADPLAPHHAPSTLIGLLRNKVCRQDRVDRSNALLSVMMPPIHREVLVASGIEHRVRFRETEDFDNLRKAALQARYIFLGIGRPLPEAATQESPRQPPSERYHSFTSMAERVSPGYRGLAERLGLIGEINHQVYDERGNNRTVEIPSLGATMTIVLNLEDLKKLAADASNHKVVGIAAGKSKFKAIDAAVRHGLVNTLVTTTEVGELLVEAARTRGRMLSDGTA